MKITIECTEKGTTLACSKPTTAPEIINILYNAILGTAKNTVESAPKEIQTQLKESLYDLINVGASYTLQVLAPEIDLRPDLTVEAILKAENEIIEEKYAKL